MYEKMALYSCQHRFSYDSLDEQMRSAAQQLCQLLVVSSHRAIQFIQPGL